MTYLQFILICGIFMNGNVMKADAFSMPSISDITDWFNLFGNYKEKQSICPPDMESCNRDKLGYIAFKSIFNTLDTDKDDKLSFEEGNGANIHSSSNRRLNGLLGERRISDVAQRYHLLWNKWVTTRVYKWTAEEFETSLTRDIGRDNTAFANIMYGKQIQGKHLPRLACKDDTYLRDLIGSKYSEIDEELIEKFRKSVADRIFFGDRKPIVYTSVTRPIPFLVLTLTMVVLSLMFNSDLLTRMKHYNAMEKYNDIKNKYQAMPSIADQMSKLD